MRHSVRPELTTASVVRGLYIDRDRCCWTTLDFYKPTPIALIYRGQTVQVNRATSDLRAWLPDSVEKRPWARVCQHRFAAMGG